MSIQEISSNFKRFFGSSDLTLALLIIGVGMGSFFLGRASVEPQNALEQGFSTHASDDGAAVTESYQKPQMNAATVPSDMTKGVQEAQSVVTEGGYVASKNGTKYHLPWCSGAQRIKEENKIWFSSKAEAEAAGYEPAANCKGI